MRAKYFEAIRVFIPIYIQIFGTGTKHLLIETILSYIQIINIGLS